MYPVRFGMAALRHGPVNAGNLQITASMTSDSIIYCIPKDRPSWRTSVRLPEKHFAYLSCFVHKQTMMIHKVQAAGR